MSSYVDTFEGRSEEELLEDEELIEAVEQFVETTAVSVWSGLVDDFKSLFGPLQRSIYVLFPLILEYEANPQSIWRDLSRACVYLVFVLVTALVLGPRRSKRSKSRAMVPFPSSSCRTVSQKEPVRRNASSPTLSPGQHDMFIQGGWNSDSDSNWCQVDENGLSDEERFERAWVTSISVSEYRRLVLPPTCRRVLSKQQGGPSRDTEEDNTQSECSQAHDDDENPAKRLQIYFRNFMGLIRSFLSYDYTHMGWMLIRWTQGIRQHRKTTIEGSNRQKHMKSPHRSSQPDKAPADTTKGNTVAQNEKQTSRIDSSALRAQSSFDTCGDDGTFEAGEAKNENQTKSVSPQHKALTCAKSLRAKRRVSDEHDSDDDDDRWEDLNKPSNTIPIRDTDEIDLHDRGPGSRQESNGTTSSDTSATANIDYDENDSRPVSDGVDDGHVSTEGGSNNLFFETAHSQDSLKRMMVEVAVPDKHGYILNDDLLPDSQFSPLLVFVNSRSGPQQGHILITQLRRLLNPIQVWDLADGSPDDVLSSFCALTRLRILVCGGDGTVSWIISSLEKLMLSRKWPPIAILPLGTGNDLARIHGWGGGYNNESLIRILKQVTESYISMLDRWELTITDKKRRRTVKNFFNYLGVGADAQAALQVHYLRESRPEWFFSRMVNKAWYGVFGAEDLIKASSVNVRKDIKLFADGVEIPLPPDSQGIILLNIDSYAGGVPLWSHGVKNVGRRGPRRSYSLGEFPRANLRRTNSLESIDDSLLSMCDEERYSYVTACDRPSSCQDGILEVVSIRGAFHLGQIKVGLSNAQRLCQCREVAITIKNKVAVQVDGEPWRQQESTLRVRRKPESAAMLHRSVDDGGIETEMSRLLDWAEERTLIDSHVHELLLKEFSRRIEDKTRQRRNRPTKDLIFSTLKKAMSTTNTKCLLAGQENSLIM